MRLELKRGSGSIVLNSATPVAGLTRHVVGKAWAPGVTRSRMELLAGDGVQTVIERVPMFVRATSSGSPAPTAALAFVEQVNRWINDAGRWWRGDAGEPLRMAYLSREPAGSWEPLREALIIGPPPGEPAVVLAADYVELLGQGVVNFVVQFERRGLMFDPETVRAATGGPWNDGTVIAPTSVALNAADTSAGRVRLTLDNLPGSDSEGVIVVAASETDIRRRLQSDAATEEGLASGGGSAISSAEAQALGGNVTLITPGSSDPFRWFHSAALSGSPTVNQQARRFAIFLSAAIGNVAVANETWRIRPVANWQDRGDEAVIWTESWGFRRRIVAAGVVTVTEPLWRFGLEFERLAGTGGIVYSHMAAVAIDTPGTRVISLPILSSLLSTPRQIEIDAAALSAREPQVTQLDPTTRMALAYQGDANLYIPMDTGWLQECLLIMANRPSTWRWRTSGATLVSMTAIDLARRPARMVAG